MNKADNIKIEKVNDTDYRSIFYMGLIFNCSGIALTIATRNPGLLGMMAFGIILMINGLINKDKWFN
jgi:hypothetical protein